MGVYLWGKGAWDARDGKWHMGSLPSLLLLFCLLTQATCWSLGAAMANVDIDSQLIRLNADIINL